MVTRLALISWLLLCSGVAAQGDLPLVAKWEIERRGASVEYVGGYEGSASPVFQAVRPPLNDSQKWFISVVSKRQCAACEKLKKDFEQADALRPWVNAGKHDDSWAHYTVFQIEDQTQGWRLAKLNLTQFPAVVIQPPINGEFGPQGTYLEPIYGYDGNAQRLSEAIYERIAAYANAYGDKQRALRQPPIELQPVIDEGVPTKRPLELPPVKKDITTMGVDLLLGWVLSQFGPLGTSALVIGGGWLFLQVRKRRQETGKTVYVPDELAAKIQAAVTKALSDLGVTKS